MAKKKKTKTQPPKPKQGVTKPVAIGGKIPGVKRSGVLPMKFGDKKRLVIVEMKFPKAKNQSQVEASVRQLHSRLDTIMAAKGVTDRTYRTQITSYYDKSIGWQAGGWFRKAEDFQMYDIDQVYGDHNGEPLQTKFKQFNVIIESYPVEGGTDDPDPDAPSKNDCLYRAMLQAWGDAKSLPSGFRQPSSLKKSLGLGRCDPVPVDRLIAAQDKLNCRVEITGDHQYTSDRQHGRLFRVNLYNGHYTVQSAKGSELVKKGPKLRKKLCVYTIDRKTKKYVAICDGEPYPLTGNKLSKAKRKPWSARCVYYRMPNRCELDLLGYYHKLDAEFKAFQNAMPGIDFRCYPSIIDVGKSLFQHYSKTIPAPDDLGQLESKWMSAAYTGGLNYHYKCETGNARQYDINKFYASIAQSQFLFPMRQGEFSKAAALSDILNPYGSPKYGVYRCEVVGKLEHPFFAKKCNRYYTHLDLKTAMDLGYEISMVDDAQPNALIYSRDKLQFGHQIFKPFVQKLHDLHLQGVPLCKQVMNALFGALSEKSTRRLYIEPMEWHEDLEPGLQFLWSNDRIGLPDTPMQPCSVYKITPMGHGNEQGVMSRNDFKVELLMNHKRFKYSWARTHPFMTAKGRRKMMEIFGKHEQHIIKVATDGVISTKPLFGKKQLDPKVLGGMKLEKCGRVTVKSTNRCKWS